MIITMKDMCPCPSSGTMHTRGMVDIACASLLTQETGRKLKGVSHRVVSTLRRPIAYVHVHSRMLES